MSEQDSYDAVVKALRMLKRIRRLEGTILIHEGVLLSADTLFSEAQNESFVREANALVSLYRNGKKPLSRAVLGFDGGQVFLCHATPFTLALLYGDDEQSRQVEAAGVEFLSKWADSLKIEEPVTELPIFGGQADSEEPHDEEADAEVSEPKMVEVPLFEKPEIEEEAESPPDETIPIPALVPVRPVEPEEAKEELEEPLQGAVAEWKEAPAPESESPSVVESDSEKEVSEEDGEMEMDPAENWDAYRSKVEALFSKVVGRAQAKRLIEREVSALGVGKDGHVMPAQFRPFGQKLIKRVKDRTLRKQLEAELLTIVDEHIG